jgi:hypothetical protein
MTEDTRGFRVAIVAGELLNPVDGGLDALAICQEEDWGVIQLPAADYPDDVAEPLLDQVAEQMEEFQRHGYTMARIGGHPGLAQALARYDLPSPPAIDQPQSAEQVRDFLRSLA